MPLERKSLPPQGRWSRYRRLPSEQRRLLLDALFLLPLNRIALRLIGYQRWRAILNSRLPVADQPHCDTQLNSPVAPQRVAQIVHAASREGFFTGACLERALALWWLLRRQHFPAELQLGARRHGGKFEAHAWVQLGGAVLNDDEALDHYAPFQDSVARVEGKS